jgi:predicted site-specific integrase-resolvase
MNTTFTLLQAAGILGVSFAEAVRLVRAGKIKAQKRTDKVRIVDAVELETFMRRAQA